MKATWLFLFAVFLTQLASLPRAVGSVLCKMNGAVSEFLDANDQAKINPEDERIWRAGQDKEVGKLMEGKPNGPITYRDQEAVKIEIPQDNGKSQTIQGRITEVGFDEKNQKYIVVNGQRIPLRSETGMHITTYRDGVVDDNAVARTYELKPKPGGGHPPEVVSNSAAKAEPPFPTSGTSAQEPLNIRSQKYQKDLEAAADMHYHDPGYQSIYSDGRGSNLQGVIDKTNENQVVVVRSQKLFDKGDPIVQKMEKVGETSTSDGVQTVTLKYLEGEKTGQTVTLNVHRREIQGWGEFKDKELMEKTKRAVSTAQQTVGGPPEPAPATAKSGAPSKSLQSTEETPLKIATWYNGNLKEGGGAFSGKYLGADNNGLMMFETKNNGILRLKKDSVDLSSIQTGRLKMGDVTSGGSRVIQGPKVRPESDSLPTQPKIVLDSNPDLLPLQKINPDIKEGTYVSFTGSRGGKLEGYFVSENSSGISIRDPVSQKVVVYPREKFDYHASVKIQPHPDEHFLAFSSQNPEARIDYEAGDYWTIYRPGVEKKLPRQGFKLHVSATPETAREIADAVLPELRSMGVGHKVATSAQDVGRLNNNLITIYPENEKQAVEIAKKIDRLLVDKGLAGKTAVIANEKAIGSSGGVYSRYGIMAQDDIKGSLILADGSGNAVDQAGQVILYQGKPISVNLPLDRQYNPVQVEEIQKLLEDKHALAPDTKGAYKPDWMKRDPFR